MKPLNGKEELWSGVTSESMEIRDEYGWCIDMCISCLIECWKCFSF